MKTITKQPDKIEYHRIIMGTQFNENYGAHDWDGSGECPQYWKAKGGSEHLVAWFHSRYTGLAETSLNRLLSVWDQPSIKPQHVMSSYGNVTGVRECIEYLALISPFNFRYTANAFVCDDYSQEYPIDFLHVKPFELTPLEKRDNEMNRDGYGRMRWVVDVEPVEIAC